MLILANVVCSDDLLNILSIVRVVLNYIQIAVPIILIVTGSITMAKAVASSDDKAQKEAMKPMMTQFVAAVAVFLLPVIVNLVLGLVGAGTGDCWKESKNCTYSTEGPDCVTEEVE